MVVQTIENKGENWENFCECARDKTGGFEAVKIRNRGKG